MDLPLQELTTQAQIMRRLIVETVFRSKDTHIGCALSCADILATLYLGGILRVNPHQPNWSERDRLILSKGHGCVALYTALHLRGFFPLSRLDTYGHNGTTIPFHSTRGTLPGIDATAGSLAHGLALGIGMALDARKNHRSSRIFVILGDGECQEGAIWESAQFAGFHALDNLTVIVDNNGQQTVDATNRVLSVESLVKKFQAFGWVSKEVPGHDLTRLQAGLHTKHTAPFALIANTIKGKGVSFMEDRTEWHNKCPSQKEYEIALQELGGNQ